MLGDLEKIVVHYQKGPIVMRNTIARDVMEMADSLREEDVEEVLSVGQDPETALLHGYIYGDTCMTLTNEGRPVVMFGVTPRSVMGSASTVWLLATPEINRIWLTFLRLCRRFMPEFVDKYRLLHNFASAENTKTIAWLKWLGAKIDPPASYGFEGKPFCHFEFRKEA